MSPDYKITTLLHKVDMDFDLEWTANQTAGWF